MNLSKTITHFIATFGTIVSGTAFAADPSAWIVANVPSQSWEKVGVVAGAPAGSLSMALRHKELGIRLDLIAVETVDDSAIEYAARELGPLMEGTKLSPRDIKGSDRKAFIGWDCKGKKTSDPDETNLAVYRRLSGAATDAAWMYMLENRATWPKSDKERDIAITREIDGIIESVTVTRNPPKDMK